MAGGVISDFRISSQFLIKENCHNSWTSNDIDMEIGAVTKLDNRNKETSKQFDYDVMSENCDDIVIFRIFGQFGAVQIFRYQLFHRYDVWKMSFPSRY